MAEAWVRSGENARPRNTEVASALIGCGQALLAALEDE